MTIDKKYIDKFINVTSKAALASSFLVGKKKKIAADQAAVDSMRNELNKIDMNGKVVIGEGVLDNAPMLYTGAYLGTKNDYHIDEELFEIFVKEGVYKKYDPDIIVEVKAEDFVPIEYLFKIFHFDRIRFSKYSKAINSFLR